MFGIWDRTVGLNRKFTQYDFPWIYYYFGLSDIDSIWRTHDFFYLRSSIIGEYISHPSHQSRFDASRTLSSLVTIVITDGVRVLHVPGKPGLKFRRSWNSACSQKTLGWQLLLVNTIWRLGTDTSTWFSLRTTGMCHNTYCFCNHEFKLWILAWDLPISYFLTMLLLWWER